MLVASAAQGVAHLLQLLNRFDGLDVHPVGAGVEIQLGAAQRLVEAQGGSASVRAMMNVCGTRPAPKRM
jgi:hypothetical protein